MIIELVGQKFRGTLRLSRQWPSSIITPMAKSKKRVIGKVTNPDDLLKKQAIGIAMFGTAEEYHEVEVSVSSPMFGDGFEEIVAPSKTPAGQPPRAHFCGYHAKAELLVIVFRGPGKQTKGRLSEDAGKRPWIFYDGIDEDTWDSLKMANSTGDWLRNELGGYGWTDVPGNNKQGLQEVVESILAS